MGSKKIELNHKVESYVEQGQEIANIGDEKIAEAEASEQALSSIEAVDDDTADAVDSARNESSGIAEGIAESEIENPGEDVSDLFVEISEESNEFGDQERENANTASEMEGDYSSVGSDLSSKFQESSSEFIEIADNADSENDSMKTQLEQIVNTLEGIF